ncbi:hypothetical protein [Paraburkholderia sp. ZP32-5]|nr:hypothetical protein [Paraburkholderia sp. ZP32-5]
MREVKDPAAAFPERALIQAHCEWFGVPDPDSLFTSTSLELDGS